VCFLPTSCQGALSGVTWQLLSAFPSMSSCRSLRYSAQAFSKALACSFDAIPNRANARIIARTLTRGSAACPVLPHLRQVMIGAWIFPSRRIWCSISSNLSRNSRSIDIDISGCHSERNRLIICGNQVRCGSPAGISLLGLSCGLLPHNSNPIGTDPSRLPSNRSDVRDTGVSAFITFSYQSVSLTLRLDSDPIIDRTPYPLLGTQVSLCRLH